MPEPILIVAFVSVVLALPTLGMAIYHGTRLEKHNHCSRSQPCEEGEPGS